MKIYIIGGATVTPKNRSFKEEKKLLSKTMTKLGEMLSDRGHDLVVCSPFPDSADYYVVCGAVKNMLNKNNHKSYIEYHFPNRDSIRSRFNEFFKELKLNRVRKFKYSPLSMDNTKTSSLYEWLFAQIKAMESSNALITVGGKQNGSASLLLRLASEQRKCVVPLTFMGGAAASYFDQFYWQLVDAVRDKIELEKITDQNRISEVPELVDSLCLGLSGLHIKSTSLRFFISYARERPQEADFIETLLRRRNQTVFRDEEKFEPAGTVYDEIRQHIYRADVFVAIWCKEYACSPWCFDELEMALQRNKEGKTKLWIICVDDTRIVPPGARGLVFYQARTRTELDGCILRLLSQSLNQETAS